ncbi:DEAD-domain-containing protein, partial [Ramicandelaber brevisporus]
CPRPALDWSIMGLPHGCDTILRQAGLEKPTAVQAQTIPAIMSGSDVIVISNTGSGKTLAFVLPLLRHIEYQRPVSRGEGPIALIVSPTHELADQIYQSCLVFMNTIRRKCMLAHGGTPLATNIAQFKEGADIVVCTPGRMIDLLCKVNRKRRADILRRVTHVVLDEADRMFDMGFEPQITRILDNVRPDRQAMMFSATFPRQVEKLARKVAIHNRLEITVGGRSTVCSTISQTIQVVSDVQAKLARLLNTLDMWFNANASKTDTRVLIFVSQQSQVDDLLAVLMQQRFDARPLHGGMDQADREAAISDFKAGSTRILIATSVAARGLDVQHLDLVVNYDCPNHYEDYLQRIGRTGRAGRSGTSITFVTSDQGRYAGWLIYALKSSKHSIPAELQRLADEHASRPKEARVDIGQGSNKRLRIGYHGKGLDHLDETKHAQHQLQRTLFGSTDDADMDSIPGQEQKISAEDRAAIAAAGTSSRNEASAPTSPDSKRASVEDTVQDPAIAAALKAARLAASRIAFDINDLPQHTRVRLTNREVLTEITDRTGAALTVRGTYVEPGKQLLITSGPSSSSTSSATAAVSKESERYRRPVGAPGSSAIDQNRRLHILIEGHNDLEIELARAELQQRASFN